MEEKKTAFNFQARYYQSGKLHSGTRQVWIVFHGYGQLAQYFIKKFEPLTQHNLCIFAPEGLSRFYLSDFTPQGRPDNKVGATWMTQENRLMDIENYIQYLNSIVEHELREFQHIPVTLLGFSQGCAAVCRWAVQSRIKFKKLVLWAGLFPPDMDLNAGHDILSSAETFMVVGDQDPYLTPTRMKEFDDLAEKLGVQPKKIIFSGKHELNEAVLEQLATEV